MSLPIIVVPLYPDVPQLPGVPQLLRSPFANEQTPPQLATSDADSLGDAASQAPQWAILDSSLNAAIVPDSFLGIDIRAGSHIPNFPLQRGSFSAYNKVQQPQEFSVRVTKGGLLSDRQQFLDTLEKLRQSIELLTVVTPERTYASLNVARYEVSRHGKEGAYFLNEVDIFFEEIREVSAQYSTTDVSSDTQNAQAPTARPIVNQGAVTPSNWPAIPNQFGPKPFVLGTDPNTVFSTLGNPSFATGP